MQVAALEAVLRLHATGRQDELPVWRMLRAPATAIRRRARAVADALGGRVVRVESAPGGGSLPGHALASWAVAVDTPKPEALAATLRTERPTIFARVDEGAVVFDLRTVPPSDDERLVRAVRYALEPS
jgi:L-seryl-tRNA(Ser) seleniumtransferase